MLTSRPEYDLRKEARERGNEVVEEIRNSNFKSGSTLEHKSL